MPMMRLSWGASVTFALALFRPCFSTGLDERQEGTDYGIAANSTGPAQTDLPDFFDKLGESFEQDAIGCAGRDLVDAYIWRPWGYGTNINMLLLPWVNGILQGRNNIAIVQIDPVRNIKAFASISCPDAPGGIEGWDCLYASMPNVCVFHVVQDWEEFNLRRGAGPSKIQAAVQRSRWTQHRPLAPSIRQALKGSGIDIIGAFAVVLQYFQSHLQPWLKRDVEAVLQENEVVNIQSEPFVSVHIRRGDKVTSGEGKRFETDLYLQTAAEFVKESRDIRVEDVRGIWLSSDDYEAVENVKEIVQRYFPEVDAGRVVWISARAEKETPDARVTEQLATTSFSMTYGIYVVLLAELEMLARGTVFVGTLSSNVGRAVLLMREARGISRNSTLSLDDEWIPGR